MSVQRQYLKFKITKYYDGKKMVRGHDDQRFEHNIYLLNGGRALLFGTVRSKLDISLPNNIIDIVAEYLNPPKYIMDRWDEEDEEEKGWKLLIYSDDPKLQKEHKMETEWNADFLQIITKWFSLPQSNEFDVHRFLQYLLSWFLSEKAQLCSNAISKLHEINEEMGDLTEEEDE